MKTWLMIAIAVFILILAAVTNPTVEQYTQWAKEQARQSQESFLGKSMVDLFGESVIENNTSYRNFIIFSIFTTKTNSNTATTVGMYRNFITIATEAR